MAKITLILCDVKPCHLPAEREFEVNGEKIYVCGESCFVKYWSREYSNWKVERYRMQTAFQYISSPANQTDADPMCKQLFETDLHLVKPI